MDLWTLLLHQTGCLKRPRWMYRRYYGVSVPTMVNCVMYLPIGTCFLDVVDNRVVHISLHPDRVLRGHEADIMRAFTEIGNIDKERATVYEHAGRIHFHFVWSLRERDEDPVSSIAVLVEVVDYMESLEVCWVCEERVAKKEVHVCEHCRSVAATMIQRRFREAISNPGYAMCKRRLMREWEEFEKSVLSH